MRIWIFACCLFTSGICVARADLTITQKVEGMGQNAENASRFKGGKTRVDTSPGASIIMDLKTGETISLNHPQKTFLKISGEIAQAAIDSVKKMQGEHPDAKSALTATGRKDSVSGYAAEEYTCTIAGVKMALWLTRELPDYQAALAEMSTEFSRGPMAAMMQNYGFDMSTLPGFPIRTVLEMQPGQTMTRTVIAVSTKPVPEADFEVPPDYHEIAAKTLTPPAAARSLPTP